MKDIMQTNTSGDRGEFIDNYYNCDCRGGLKSPAMSEQSLLMRWSCWTADDSDTVSSGTPEEQNPSLSNHFSRVVILMCANVLLNIHLFTLNAQV